MNVEAAGQARGWQAVRLGWRWHIPLVEIGKVTVGLNRQRNSNLFIQLNANRFYVPIIGKPNAETDRK